MQAILQAWAELVSMPFLLIGKTLAWLFAHGLVCRLLEVWRPLRRAPLLRPNFWQDLGYHLITALVPAMVFVAVAIVLVQILRGWVPTSLHQALAGWPMGLRVALGLLVGDFAYYWAHRWQHEWPGLWRLHAVHHSPTHMDWLVNTRAHPFDLAFARLIAFVPTFYFGLAGSSPAQGHGFVLAMTVITGYQAYIVHANTRLRITWLEPWLVTPVFHHWHHNHDGPSSLNKNFGGVFPWWDRLFGTFQPPPAERGGFPQAYGIEEDIPPGLLRQLFAPSVRRRAEPEVEELKKTSP